MERYRILEELGSGTAGIVYRALDVETFEFVAVKKMKRQFFSWEACLILREVKSLRKLKHPNIIKLLEIILENNELFLIFEHMEGNLLQLMQLRETHFSEEEIRGFMSQVLHGLVHVHKHGYFHRDLKPENLLVTRNTIKIADFGLARELSSTFPLTDYVATRWYRAPEVLLRSLSYTPAMDMWSVGAILAELFMLRPIFPGESEIDQIYKICCVLGMPYEREAFPDVTNLVEVSFPRRMMPAADIFNIIPNASWEANDLIKKLLSWNPSMRPTAEQCLKHPFFNVTSRIPRSLPDSRQLNLGSELDLELNLWSYGNTSESDDLVKLTSSLPKGLPPKIQETREEDKKTCSGLYDHRQEPGSFNLSRARTDSGVHSSAVPSDRGTSSPLSLTLSLGSVPHRQPQSSAWLSMSSFQSNISKSNCSRLEASSQIRARIRHWYPRLHNI